MCASKLRRGVRNSPEAARRTHEEPEAAAPEVDRDSEDRPSPSAAALPDAPRPLVDDGRDSLSACEASVRSFSK
jgi:hypothetical protein